jgi:hypothetical protein
MSECRITDISLFKATLEFGTSGSLVAEYDLIETNKELGVIFHGTGRNSDWGEEVTETLLTLQEKMHDDLMAKHFILNDSDKPGKKKTIDTLFAEKPDAKKKEPRSI